MAGVSPATLRDLAAPTPPEEVKVRPAFNNTPALKYVDARFVLDRLDAVVGPENWQSQFQPTGFPESVRCGIGILVDQTEYVNNGSAEAPQWATVPGTGGAVWVWKWDVGTASNIEPVKGAHSDALKRAAVSWGIARDLYDNRSEMVGVPTPPPQQSQRPPVAQRPPQQQPMVQTAGQPGASPWLCPQHNQVKVVPGGVSSKTGNPYDAFLACPVQGCNYKPPRGTQVPPAMLAAAQPPQYQQPPLPQPPNGDPANYYTPDGEPLPY